MIASVESHPKFKKLKRRLGNAPLWQVKGVLESIWNLTAQAAYLGNIGKLSNEEIAASIEWEGDADKLMQDLVECGWLDEDEMYRLVVHDWLDHAPKYVKGNIARHKKPSVSQRNLLEEPPKGASQRNLLEEPPSKPNQTKPNQTKPNQTKQLPRNPSEKQLFEAYGQDKRSVWLWFVGNCNHVTADNFPFEMFLNLDRSFRHAHAYTAFPEIVRSMSTAVIDNPRRVGGYVRKIWETIDFDESKKQGGN